MFKTFTAKIVFKDNASSVITKVNKNITKLISNIKALDGIKNINILDNYDKKLNSYLNKMKLTKPLVEVKIQSANQIRKLLNDELTKVVLKPIKIPITEIREVLKKPKDVKTFSLNFKDLKQDNIGSIINKINSIPNGKFNLKVGGDTKVLGSLISQLDNIKNKNNKINIKLAGDYDNLDKIIARVNQLTNKNIKFDYMSKEMKKVTNELTTSNSKLNAYNQGFRVLNTNTREHAHILEKIRAGLSTWYFFLHDITMVVRSLNTAFDFLDKTVSINAQMGLLKTNSKSSNDYFDDMSVKAKNAGISLNDFADNVSQIGILTGESFGDTSNIIKYVDLMSKLFRVEGAGAMKIASTLYQTTQGLGAGFLEGRDLKSIANSSPLIIQALQKVKDVPSVFADGIKVSAKDLIDAIVLLAPEIEEKFSKLPVTFDRIINKFKTNLSKSVNDIMKSAQGEQAFNDVVNLVDKILTGFSNVINAVLKVLVITNNFVNYLKKDLPFVYGLIKYIGLSLGGWLILKTITSIFGFMILNVTKVSGAINVATYAVKGLINGVIGLNTVVNLMGKTWLGWLVRIVAGLTTAIGLTKLFNHLSTSPEDKPKEYTTQEYEKLKKEGTLPGSLENYKVFEETRYKSDYSKPIIDTSKLYGQVSYPKVPYTYQGVKYTPPQKLTMAEEIAKAEKEISGLLNVNFANPMLNEPKINVGGGKLDQIDKIREPVDINSSELEKIRELLVKEQIINLTQVTPNITFTHTGDVNNGLDYRQFVTKVTQELKTVLEGGTNGYYSR